VQLATAATFVAAASQGRAGGAQDRVLASGVTLLLTLAVFLLFRPQTRG